LTLLVCEGILTLKVVLLITVTTGSQSYVSWVRTWRQIKALHTYSSLPALKSSSWWYVVSSAMVCTCQIVVNVCYGQNYVIGSLLFCTDWLLASG